MIILTSQTSLIAKDVRCIHCLSTPPGAKEDVLGNVFCAMQTKEVLAWIVEQRSHRESTTWGVLEEQLAVYCRT